MNDKEHQVNEGYGDYLYARPSFLEGVARVIDWGNTLSEYNASNTGWQADSVALWMDWIAVGQAIRHATGEFEEEADGLELVPQVDG